MPPADDNGTGSDQDDHCRSRHRVGLQYRDANLPPWNPDFVGREQLEWTLRELSERCRWGRDGVPPEVIYIDAADQAEPDQRRPLLPGFLRHLPPGAAYAVVLCFSQEVAARHRSGIYAEALLAIEEYRLLPPGSIYLIPVRLSECEIPPIELTPTRTRQDLQHEDIFPAEHRPAALDHLLQSLAAAKRERA